MRTLAAAVVGTIACVAGITILRAAADPLPWAYAIPPATSAPAPAPDTTSRRLPGSDQSYTQAQLRDMSNAADWWPGDHPVMPEVVVHGRKPDVRACGVCHYPNGKGKPDNAGVAGLPVAYFVQQLVDFKNGVRKSAEPRKANAIMMAAIAKAMTDEEMRSAAEYYASMKWTPWIKVVEAAMVPKAQIVGAVYIPLAAGGTEPIGPRLIEVPEDPERFETFRDPRSGFIAYVPPGSLKKGAALVTTGGSGKTTACAVCHGADLLGLGPVPGIAGRSPSYLARQLYDMRQGTRHGLWADLMKPVVSKLTDDDILAIVAYTASRMPEPAAGEGKTVAR